MELKIGKYVLDTDVETARTLADAAEIKVERNDEAHRRNFLEAVKALPAAVQEFLTPLGLDINHPYVISENGKSEDGRHWYTAWYYMPGTIVEMGQEIAVTEECFCEFQKFCFRVPEDFPQPRFQVNLDVCLPWVLEEENPKG